MLVDRARRDQFSSTRNTALSAVRMQVAFVLANRKHLALEDRRGRKLAKVLEIDRALKACEDIAPWQYAVAEEAYEKTMLGGGYESVNVHVDKKRRSLKFG